MKVTQHVENLLRQGKKPAELVELGFPQRVVTTVRRRLSDERKASQLKTPKSRSRSESAVNSPAERASIEQKLTSLESQVRQLRTQVERLEASKAELEEIGRRLNGSPVVGLKDRFWCTCGASGFVALHIQCTKCGRDTRWGWFPESLNSIELRR